MKQFYFYIAILTYFSVNAQGLVQNTGALKVFEGGQLGFHLDLANDGVFDENKGLVGFYGDNSRTISGAFKPVFEDFEVLVAQNLFLETAVGVWGNNNFIMGDIITPRNELNYTLDFINNCFYTGETNLTKVDGYVSLTNKTNFLFPVGDASYIRPLTLYSQSENSQAKCAYFYENPNTPSTFRMQFNTDSRAKEVRAISTTEFWDIDSSIPSTISISWNERSNISNFVDAYNQIGIAGWHGTEKKWLNLGSVNLLGDLNQGTVTSETFIPDDYEIITLAKMAVATSLPSFDNYLVSNNGDGINDFLYIPELEQSPKNRIRIFDRNGLKVFEFNNYQNEFTGISNVSNAVYQRKIGLPRGVYFYLVYLDDLQLEFQGFLYLTN